MTIFNYFEANIKNSTPLGTVTLERFLHSIKNPKPPIERILNLIRSTTDITIKAHLKQSLFAFTPCVLVNNSRKYENIKSFTGLLVLDFDKIENAQEFRQYLFDSHSYIIAAWLSSSAKGVRALVKIPICESIDEFKSRFNAIERELNIYEGFDSAPKNCILPLFISQDKNLLYRDNATTFLDKFSPIVSAIIPYRTYSDGPNEKIKSVCTIITRRIDSITDAGHLILRSTSYLLGGYVGAGHIGYYDAEALIINLINSHPYLSKKAPTYIKTAKTMIQQGSQKPTYIS